MFLSSFSRKFSTSALVDSFGRIHNYLRISVTERCNLRCQYCMPDEGIQLTPDSQTLATEEIIRLAKFFVSFGITKIRFTGGEPTVRKDLVDLFKEINQFRSIGLKTIGITSNGIVLKRLLDDLTGNGLNMVNISLDTFDPVKFQLVTRRLGHDRVLDSIQYALDLQDAGKLTSVKVNCVLMKNVNSDEIMKFAEFTKSRNLEVRFIEYMPFQGNKWKDDKMIRSELVREIITQKLGLERLQSEANETSKQYRIPGHLGTIGFISSMSDHFCATCNRLRLTADGNIKVCLFDAKEISLRDILRSKTLSTDQINQQLKEVISAAVLKKKKAHGGLKIDQLLENSSRPMIKIGG